MAIPCLALAACSGAPETTPAGGGTAGTMAQGTSGSAGVAGSTGQGASDSGLAGATAQGGSGTAGTAQGGSAGSAGNAQGGAGMAGSGGSGAAAGLGGAGQMGGSGGAAVGGSDAGGSAGASDMDPDDATPPMTAEALCQHLEALPPPEFDSEGLVSFWEAFASDYSDRSYGTMNNLSAGERLRDELNTAGYSAEIREFSSLPGDVRVVEGLKTGTNLPNTYVGLSSHYDIVPTTSMGAYDNASGVAVQLEICKLLAQVETRKSIACLFFDAEELGGLASGEYVSEVAEPAELQFDQVFGYDMVGLNYPAMDSKLYAFLGLDTVALRPLVPSHSALLNAALFDCLGEMLDVDESGFEIVLTNDRNSDEANFTASNIPAVRFAGGRTASGYNGYHNEMDTVENIYELTGGRESFASGMAMAVAVSYYSILAFDLYDPADVPEF